MGKINKIKTARPPIAHSEDKEIGVFEQPYETHVANVLYRAVQCFDRMAVYYMGENVEVLRDALRLAATYHDLGKLDDLSQEIFYKERKGKLLNHVDAGVACMLHLYEKSNRKVMVYILAALLIDAHHRGLLNKILNKPEKGEEKIFLRGVDLEKKLQFLRSSIPVIEKYPYYEPYLDNESETVRQYVDRHLKHMLEIHDSVVPLVGQISGKEINPFIHTFVLRFLLSCLVEGDHWDTARHYKEAVSYRVFDVRAQERLRFHLQQHAKIDREKIGKEREKNKIRDMVHADCVKVSLDSDFYIIPALVGNAKTIGSNVLGWRLIDEYNLRGIEEVVPFNNVIKQNIEEIQKFTVLDGEKNNEIIGEHHQNADYFTKAQDDKVSYKLMKIYNMLWQNITVFTSSVQFFETCASNYPSKLRKFHQVPGRVIIIDEFHTAISMKLLRQSFKWLKQLAKFWSCKIILLSGSPVNFWKIDELKSCDIEVKDVLSKKTKRLMYKAERGRIKYYRLKKTYTFKRLLKFIKKKPGPRIVICNTVYTAAKFANYVRLNYGKEKVIHISTAFTPYDRDKVYETIKNRLNNKEDDDWILVATSCIDTGVNFSFKTGFRESCSLMSLLQLAGRVNRNNEYNCCTVYDFRIDHNYEGTTNNPAFSPSIRVLKELFRENKIGHKYCTEAIQRELIERNKSDKNKAIEKYENDLDYGGMANKFKMITSAYHTIIVDSKIINEIDNGEPVSYKKLMRGSVQIYFTKIDRKEFSNNIKIIENENIDKYKDKHIKALKQFNIWTGEYDPDFLGYMKEILGELGEDVDY